MAPYRWIKTLASISALFVASFSFLFLKPHVNPSNLEGPKLFASNTYLGPTKPIPGHPKLIRVEVLVNDAYDASGPQVVRVEFNRINIPLKPRDIYGNRGSGSFQVPPGKYKLQWTINQDKANWPRTIVHEEEVTISPRDLWIQILIEGEEVTIS